MNILIKLTCLIGLVIAPILGDHDPSTEQDNQESTEVIIFEEGDQKIIMIADEDGSEE